MFQRKKESIELRRIHSTHKETIQEELNRKLQHKKTIEKSIDDYEKQIEKIQNVIEPLVREVEDIDSEIEFLKERIEGIQYKEHERKKQGCFVISSNDENLPVHCPEEMYSLFLIIQLINQKFGIDEVLGEFYLADPEKMYIYFDDNVFVCLRGVDQHEDKRPIDFLRTFKDVVLTKDRSKYVHLSHTIVKFNTALCEEMIAKLNKLPDFTASEIDGPKRFSHSF
ncbi:MAG: hypothetical protein SFW66_07305 [Gammaproteobacteria bacterium]|nr:hypothetical protein [Gammaproteobacteria bacterium]